MALAIPADKSYWGIDWRSPSNVHRQQGIFQAGAFFDPLRNHSFFGTGDRQEDVATR